jgi:putative ABC transport system permease protein
LKLTLLGIAAGLAASVYFSRYLEAQLYGVQRVDALSFAIVVAVLAAVAALACFIPAWRATRLDASTALRHE